jgi:hypothetical protein
MKRTRFLLLPALALLLLIGLLGLGSQRLGLVHASGTTLQVTNCHDSGPGSLRDAIASAASGSIITFGLSCDIKLKSTLIISKTLTLIGEGQQVTLDGQQAVQVLSVSGGVTLTLKTLTIAKGSSLDAGGIANSGTLRISNSTVSGNSQAGIDNYYGATLQLTDSTVSDNTAGGINNSGTLRISTSTVSGNAIFGIVNGRTLQLTNSTVSGNSGDGIDNYSGTVSLTNSAVFGNSDNGIYNFAGTLRISTSTASGNSQAGIENHGTLQVTNSTFFGNPDGGIFSDFGVTGHTGGGISNSTVSGNSGAGIFNLGSTLRISTSTVSGNSGDGIFNGATLQLTNSTVSGNSGDGIDNEYGGTLQVTNSTVPGNTDRGIYNNFAALYIGGSIMANNTEGNCARALIDQGYNLSSDSSCRLTASTSLLNTDPKLDPAGLANNGGPTQTIALQPDSPAVDLMVAGSSCPATDQRGVSRPQGPQCDLGAFEMTAADGLKVMVHVVNSFQLAKGLQTSLDQQVQTVLADQQTQQIAQACRDLTNFINHVQAQSGKGLTSAQVTQLLKQAAVIHTRLGC